jgi:hypothetical protein
MQLAPFTAKKTLFIWMLFILTCSTVFMTVTARAHNADALNAAVKVSKQEKVNMPVVAGARVFTKFDDSMPAVINYFTPLAEDKTITFYNESYGQPTKQARIPKPLEDAEFSKPKGVKLENQLRVAALDKGITIVFVLRLDLIS